MFSSELRRRKVRSAMTITAVAISVTMLLTMLSFAEGLQARVEGDLDDSREDIIIGTESWAGVSDGHSIVGEVEAVEGVGAASPFLTLPLLASPDAAESGKLIGAIGIVPDSARPFLDSDMTMVLNDLRIEFRDWFDEGGDPHYAGGTYAGPWTGEALIDLVLAERFDLVKGDTLYLTGGERGEFVVTGLFDDGLAEEGLATDILVGAALIHLSELQTLRGVPAGADAGDPDAAGLWDQATGDGGAGGDGGTTGGTTDGGTNGTAGAGPMDDSVTGISIRVDRAEGSLDQVADDLKEMFPFYRVATKEDRLAMQGERIAWARMLYTITGSVALTIGLLFVATIMVMSVYERTAELGMMRAIGISRRTIFTQVMGQSLALTAMGCAVGAVLGYFSTGFFSDYVGAQYGLSEPMALYSPEMVASSVAMVLLFSVVFSLYPSWRAVRVDVVEALKQVA